MSQHLWLVFTDIGGVTYYLPYEALAALRADPGDPLGSEVHCVSGLVMRVPGTVMQIYGALYQQLAAQGETFIAAQYPTPTPPPST